MHNHMQHLAASEEMTDSAEASAAIHHKKQSEMIRVLWSFCYLTGGMGRRLQLITSALTQ